MQHWILEEKTEPVQEISKQVLIDSLPLSAVAVQSHKLHVLTIHEFPVGIFCYKFADEATNFQR